MFTFGYNSKLSSILRACSAIALGAVMIISSNATETVVKIFAAFLFAAGVISLANGYVQKRSGGFSLMAVNASIDIVLGLLLFLYPAAVAHLIVYLVGAMLLIFGLIQVVALAGTMSLLGAGWPSLLLSAIGIAVGVVIIFNPFSQGMMSILSGCGLIYYGAVELMSIWRVAKAKKVYEVKFAERVNTVAEPDSEIIIENLGSAKEVDFEKVDEQ